jgi:phosphatidylglycerophosphate synthase
MHMTNDNIHYTIYDRPLKWTILLLIPRWVLPNYVTVVRFLMTPFVLIMLWRDQWVASLILFAIAASTDMIDGALARTRKQITEWGTVADPIADKLLIGSVVVVFVARAINLSFALAILVLELMIILGAWYRHRRDRPNRAQMVR